MRTLSRRAWCGLLLIGAMAWQPSHARSPEAQADQAARQEVELLHRPLRSKPGSDLFAQFTLWDKNTFRVPSPAELPSPRAKVVLLHLWAEWCGPCREEMPVWKELLPLLQRTHGPDLAVVFVSESSDLMEFLRFQDDNRARMPKVPLYGDSGEVLLGQLREFVQGHSIPLPITLLLDERRVIRWAAIGSFQSKKAQLTATIPKLLALASAESARR
jgi:thiol-disulfide isomerase/thioredoxin